MEDAEAVLREYNYDKTKLVPILQAVQARYNWLSKELLSYIACALGLPPARVYGVATFYAHFSLKPKGKNIIRLCDGTACHVKGSTSILDALYEKYGFYGERTLNLVMPGLDGLEKMRALMAQLRREPLQEIAGTKVVRMRDYQDGSVYVMGLGKMDKTPISGSNVLYFELDDGCSFIVRPSGTEPKIKVYILGVGATRAECDERVQRYAQFAETLRG